MFTLALGMIACMAIAVTISVSASNRAIRQNQQQEIEQQQARDRLAADLAAKEAAQRVIAKKATCDLVNLQVKVFEENDPTSPLGRDLAEAWRTTARVYGCT